MVCWLCDDNPSVAAVYLDMALKARDHHTRLALPVRVAMVREWCGRCSQQDKIEFRYPKNLKQWQMRQTAARFVGEAFLFNFLLDANSTRGVAPRTEDLLHEYHRLWPFANTPNVDNRPKAILNAHQSLQWHWAESFRKRWGVRIGKLSVQTDFEPGEVHKKAAGLLTSVTPKEGLFFDPQNGVTTQKPSSGGPKLGPKSDPTFGSVF